MSKEKIAKEEIKMNFEVEEERRFEDACFVSYLAGFLSGTLTMLGVVLFILIIKWLAF